MITAPEIWAKSTWFCRKNAPNADAAKPRMMNTVDRPSTKNSADTVARLRPRPSLEISPTLMPDM